MNGITVRTMPGGPRNGLPVRTGGYVYRGTGEDIMPWAITSDTSVASDELTGVRTRNGSKGRDTCQVCRARYGSRRHKIACKGEPA